MCPIEIHRFLDSLDLDAEIAYDEPMSARTSLRIGGPADVIVSPRSADAAIKLARSARAEGIAVTFIGAGANVLVGDRGIRGVVLDTSGLNKVRLGEDGSLIAGAGCAIDSLCLEACCRALAGLEDFAGMPGSVGGAAYMNARCYEREMSEVLARVAYLPAAGREASTIYVTLDGDWSYKRSPFQGGGQAAGGLILEAAFRLRPGDPASIARAMRARVADREAKGHYRLPSAGSVFKNDRRLGKPTGMILDSLGFRGRRLGGALVAPWHANIFVNAGNATAADFLGLIELARSEARERLGVELEPEVLAIGEF